MYDREPAATAPAGRPRTWARSAAALLLVLSALVIGPASAPAPASAEARPTCASAESDPDGDGWGWENDQSCIVEPGTGSADSSEPEEGAAPDTPTQTDRPTCASAASDPDGDGWGWENGQSCIVEAVDPLQDSEGSGEQATSGTPTCVSAASDPDGDGWGWENDRSCRVGSTSIPSPVTREPVGEMGWIIASTSPNWVRIQWEVGDADAFDGFELHTERRGHRRDVSAEESDVWLHTTASDRYFVVGFVENSDGSRTRAIATNSVYANGTVKAVSVGTGDGLAPFAPAVLMATEENASGVGLAWGQAAGASEADGYLVFRNSLLIGQTTDRYFVDGAGSDESWYNVAAVRDGDLSLSDGFGPPLALDDATSTRRTTQGGVDGPETQFVVSDQATSINYAFQEDLSDDSLSVQPSELAEFIVNVRDASGFVVGFGIGLIEQFIDEPPYPTGMEAFSGPVDNEYGRKVLTAESAALNGVLHHLGSHHRVGTYDWIPAGEAQPLENRQALGEQMQLQQAFYEEVLATFNEIAPMAGYRLNPAATREIIERELLQYAALGMLVDTRGSRTGEYPDGDDDCTNLGCEGFVYSIHVEDYSAGAQGGYDEQTQQGEQIGGQADNDGDGIDDFMDDDDDNDGTPDAVDEDPWDPTKSDFDMSDYDGDGIRDYFDPDDDNDGVGDFADPAPQDSSISERDSDGDGVPDSRDTDDDNDGTPDDEDEWPFNPDLPAPGGGGGNNTTDIPYTTVPDECSAIYACP